MKKYLSRPTKNDDDKGTDDWMLTYGDLVTQLLCFFILLMSFSIVSSMKFREAALSLQEALGGIGVLPSWQSNIDEIPRSPTHRIEDEKMLELKKQIREYIEKNKMSEHVKTEMRTEGLVIILVQKDPPVFFDTGDARIKKEAYPILDQIGQIIRDIPNNIRIEGHTDIRPINTPQFPSNWELSVMRATNVLRYFHEMLGTGPQRLSAAGYGPYRPIAPSDTAHGMSSNRRVEMIIVRIGTAGRDSEAEAEEPRAP